MGWLLLFWGLGGCQGDGKGSPCRTHEECRLGLKCFAGACGDGRQDSLCTQDTECLTSLSFFCIQGRCQAVSRPLPEGEALIKEPPTSSEKPEPTTSDGFPEEKTCQGFWDCTPGSVCLLHRDGEKASCSVDTFACLRSQDCPASSGQTCRPIQMGASTTRFLCSFPPASALPLKKLGEACRADQECLNGVCLRDVGLCSAPCIEETDCPSPLICTIATIAPDLDHGLCSPRCQTAADCPRLYRCGETGACEIEAASAFGGPCRSASDCPKGSTCFPSWEGGFCLLPCLAFPCPSSGRCLTKEPCTPHSFTGQMSCLSSCPPRFSCTVLGLRDLACLPTCTEDASCRPGYVCASAVADQSGSAAKTNVCLPQGPKALGETCKEDSDCQTRLCRLFGQGWICTQTCHDRCPAGMACQDQGGIPFCIPFCIQDSDCAEGQACLQQICSVPLQIPPRAVGEACDKDEQCQSLFCLRGEKFPHGTCAVLCEGALQRACGQASDPPCPAGLLCQTIDGKMRCSCPSGSLCAPLSGASVCLKTCAKNEDCGRSDYFCEGLPLRDPLASEEPLACQADGGCPALSIPVFCRVLASSSVCMTGLCFGRGRGLSRDPCLVSSDCRSGLCLAPLPSPSPPPMPCQKDSHCSSVFPRCDLSLGRCVSCLSSSACPSGFCSEGRCFFPGLCTEICDPLLSTCPQGMLCSERRNRLAQKMAPLCLPSCGGDPSCPRGFTCQTIRHEGTSSRSCQP